MAKYYCSCVLLIKNENLYLKEWIDWHLNIFDHIYIYDNGDEERVEDIVNKYDDKAKSKITIIDWSGTYNNIQEDAYNNFIDTYKNDNVWCIFLDSDEYFHMVDKSINLKEFLKNHEDFIEVYGSLRIYTANSQEKYVDELIQKRFNKPTKVYEGVYMKNFIQINKIEKIVHLWAYYRHNLVNGINTNVFKNKFRNEDLFIINHYYTKSWEEWNKKILKRGTCEPNFRKRLDEFFYINPDMEYLKSQVEDMDAEQKYQENKR